MNLLDHVLGIRLLIHRAFDGKFERLGIMNDGFVDIQLSDEDIQLRKRIKGIIYTNLPEQNGDHAKARDYTLKQCVFTLFNRLAAIKLMEQKELFPEVIKQRTENGGLSAAHQQWLEEHPECRSLERDGLLPFIEDKFKELAQDIPVYRADYPYSMFPTADEMNEIIRAFNQIEDDPDCQTIWKGDDILGWLYENFNAAEKVEFKNSGAKTEYDKVSLQSQVYTPSWVVKFLVDNTLGKLYLEMYPESQIDKPDINGNRKYSIANRPTRQMRTPQDLRTLRVIDPACGSGNFLLYAFMLLYDLYIDQMENFGKDYNRREIPALIIEDNLFGVDLDERAVQLAQIGLLIKAREVGGRRARMPHHTNIVCSNFYLPPYEEVEREFGYDASWTAHLNSIARKIWTDLSEAYKFGTLVRVEEQLKAIAPDDGEYTLFSQQQEMDDLFGERNRMKTMLHNLANMYGEKSANPYTLLKMNEAMTFLDIISNPYDVVVANPPYTDSADFGTELKNFIEENYRKPLKFNSNLYACFIKRCCELAGSEGKIGMIHPHTFMFIKTFEDVRKFMLDHTHINVMVDYGLDRVNLFGPGILLDATFYTLDLNKRETTPGVFFNITANQQEKYKKGSLEQAYADYLNNHPNDRVYTLSQSKLKGIKSYPFIYWISDEFREKFADEDLDHVLYIRQGLASGDNNRFLRFWWEIDRNTISEHIGDKRKWVKYSKGGPYEKWYGNFWLTIAYDDENQTLLANSGNHLPSRQFYFKEGVTYSAVGSKGITFRYLPENYLIDAKGPGVFPGKFKNVFYTLAFLNTKLIFYICDCLDPTVSINQGDIKRVPLAYPSNEEEILMEKLASQNVSIKKQLCQYSLIELLYNQSPIKTNKDVITSISDYFTYYNALLTQILLNESIINNTVFEVYKLSKHDIKMVLDKEGIPVGNLPVSHEAKVAYRRWLTEEGEYKLLNEVMEHLDSLEERSDLLQITDFENLYQNNNDWEEFCIKHDVNPIEAWYQFRNAGVLPPQRTQVLAFELITDVIRSLLAKDDDGVIPLTTNAGETNLAPRIEAEMVDRGYKPAQIAQIFTLLGGGNLERYLCEKYFQQLSDHLNLFMYLPKTPFIWHITSGQHHALELFISIYTWSRDTLLRIKSVYAANREAALNDRLQVLLQGDAIQKAEAAEVRAQIKELTDFCNKIDSLLASGYNPKLDDGVGKNIAPLQKAGIISYDVLKSTQLSKYLNADW